MRELSILFLFFLTLIAVVRSDENYAGPCGIGISYKYERSTNTLTIYGTGSMYDYENEGQIPWSSYKKDIKKVVFEGSVDTIAQNSFKGCENMKSIVLPESLRWIKAGAFGSCKSLETITFPENVESIPFPNMFEDCKSLTEIKVDKNNRVFKDVDGVLFYKTGNQDLVSYPPGKTGNYVVPGWSKVITKNAFSNCFHLKSVVISNGVESIGEQAFFFSSLTELTIPASVTWIGSGAFQACTDILSFNVDKDNTNFQSKDGVLFSKDGKTLIRYTTGKFGGYVIPDGVTTIEDKAFKTAKSLRYVIIPATVKTIGHEAFYEAITLERVAYLGKSDPVCSDSFGVIFQSYAVCVLPGYKSSSFCGHTSFCAVDSCATAQHDYCYRPYCENGRWFVAKSYFGEVWDRRTNGCAVHECRNKTGYYSKSLCDDSRTGASFCKDEKCVVNEAITDKRWTVAITFEPGDKEVVANASKVSETVESLTGVSPSKHDVAFDLDPDGLVRQMSVFVNDFETADVIANKIKNIEPTITCAHSFCRKKDAFVQASPLWTVLQDSASHSTNNIFILLSLLVLMMINILL